MADESIIPARNVTPVLRADATDDHLDLEAEAEEAEAVADEEESNPLTALRREDGTYSARDVLPPEGSGIEVGDTAEEVEKKLDAFEVAMVCPICELPQCGHNLQKVMKS